MAPPAPPDWAMICLVSLTLDPAISSVCRPERDCQMLAARTLELNSCWPEEIRQIKIPSVSCKKTEGLTVSDLPSFCAFSRDACMLREMSRKRTKRHSLDPSPPQACSDNQCRCVCGASPRDFIHKIWHAHLVRSSLPSCAGKRRPSLRIG